MQDKEQFTRIAGAYMDTVFRVALNYLKDRDGAEDICQEVFLRLWRTETAFASEEHVKYWLIRVAVNECKRSLGAPWRRTEPLEDREGPPQFDDPESGELFQLVMGLPRKYRVALYLHYYEGYATGEIAALLGVPKSTVTTRLKRGRELLKTTLLEAENV